MPLRNRDSFPPQGWLYTQPETGWSAPNPLNDSFTATCSRIQAHRRANPSLGASLDLDDIAEDLEAFTGKRLGYNPRFWFDGPRPDLKKKKPGQPRFPERSSAGRVAALVEAVKRLSVGSRTLADWIGDGAFPVHPALAARRASVCAACPRNQRQAGALSGLTSAVAEAVKGHLHTKRQLGLTLEQEESLATCTACGCHLPLKVWVPHRHIARTQPDDTRAALESACWMLHEEQRLLVVLPFTNHDYPAAHALLEWIGELGGCPHHACLLLADCKVGPEKREALLPLALAAFGDVEMIATPYPLQDETWPIGPNWMFATLIRHLADRPQPFFWLEPDCIPLQPHWLEALEGEYQSCGLPLLGNIIPNTSPGYPQTKRHINGGAVYPPGSLGLFAGCLDTRDAFGAVAAWDMAGGDTIADLTHDTRLIHHFWGAHDQPPTFVLKKLPGGEDRAVTLDFLKPGAVLFHRCKDQSLIRCLRETRPKTKSISP